MSNNMRTTKASTWIQNMMKNLQKKDIDEEKKLFNDIHVNVDVSMYNYLGDIQKSINNINFIDILTNAKEIIQNDISTDAEDADAEDANAEDANVVDANAEDADAKFYSKQIETELKWLDKCYELKNELRQKLIPDPMVYYRVDVDNPPTFLSKIGINPATNNIGENYAIMKDGIKSITGTKSIQMPSLSNIMNSNADETSCDIVFKESNNFDDVKNIKILSQGKSAST